jgi:hypothetical protein
LIDIEHFSTTGGFLNRLLSLTLSSQKQNRFSLNAQLKHKLNRILKKLKAFLQINYVNTIPLPEDIFLHLRIPAFGLVAEMNSRLQQLFHGYRNQIEPPQASASRIGISCEPPSDHISFVL